MIDGAPMSARERSRAYSTRGQWRQLDYPSQEDAAMLDFAEAIRLDATNEEAFLGRAEFYRTHRRYDLEEADLDEAVRVAPTRPNAYFVRCLFNREHERFDAALADCNNYLRLQTDTEGDRVALDVRAGIQIRRGEFEAAIEDYNTLLARIPVESIWAMDPPPGTSYTDYESALYGRGVARLHLGDTDGATDIERARSTNREAMRRFDLATDDFWVLLIKFDDLGIAPP